MPFDWKRWIKRRQPDPEPSPRDGRLLAAQVYNSSEAGHRTDRGWAVRRVLSLRLHSQFSLALAAGPKDRRGLPSLGTRGVQRTARHLPSAPHSGQSIPIHVYLGRPGHRISGSPHSGQDPAPRIAVTSSTDSDDDLGYLGWRWERRALATSRKHGASFNVS